MWEWFDGKGVWKLVVGNEPDWHDWGHLWKSLGEVKKCGLTRQKEGWSSFEWEVTVIITVLKWRIICSWLWGWAVSRAHSIREMASLTKAIVLISFFLPQWSPWQQCQLADPSSTLLLFKPGDDHVSVPLENIQWLPISYWIKSYLRSRHPNICYNWMFCSCFCRSYVAQWFSAHGSAERPEGDVEWTRVVIMEMGKRGVLVCFVFL